MQVAGQWPRMEKVALQGIGHLKVHIFSYAHGIHSMSARKCKHIGFRRVYRF